MYEAGLPDHSLSVLSLRLLNVTAQEITLVCDGLLVLELVDVQHHEGVL